MTPEQIETALAFGAVAPTLYAAHAVGDHWVQSHTSACAKGNAGAAGHLACLTHVLTYLATCLVAVLGVTAALGILGTLSVLGVAVGLAVNGITHYVIDRRKPLAALARLTGHGGWLDADPEAAYKLDQSWHLGWLLISALITVTL
ncbi:DUF3307 domain-containing protein [Glycomyces albidus]|uniref:DUF3307 domain-containing protein n=1 Tax=Glycomyces albidus TaxID=2656774 RepID=A0A6L5GAA1_9ACTN|nr:DUF3307 domain-containing protein [Glycomyces albidus]MQM26642.1 DUF3307 domain-containing protein [Glycomyces albidus]